MKQIPNVNYGSRKPEPVEHLDVIVVLNSNITEHEHEDGNYWTADTVQYTNAEYIEYLEKRLDSDNADRDELIAELLEGL